MNLTKTLDAVLHEVRLRLANTSIRSISKSTGIVESGLYRAKAASELKISLRTLQLLTDHFDTLNPTENNNMTTALETTATRSEIVDEIARLENCISELKSNIPSAYDTIYRFRVKPGKFAWIYAPNIEEAERSLSVVMGMSYDDWSKVSEAFDQWAHPQDCVGLQDGNIFTWFQGEGQGKRLYADWVSDQLTSEKKNGIQRDHKPALQRAAEEFQQFN
ncbi:MAG: hypothetical protein COA78_05740 [Blastopirellula sp.]|nr:MAG: hypothetical protein COA78_05740 [Blastopirellula sp.]